MVSNPRPRLVNQLGMDEQLIEDAALEEALETRQDRKEVAAEARKAYDEAHDKASAEVEKLELPEETAVRVGRFRITRSSVKARSVKFETKATTRVSISVIGEE